MSDDHGLLPDEGPAHEVLGRLVIVMVREAVTRKFNEIQIDLGADCFPVHLVRDAEVLELDSLPVRLFAPLLEHVARMCGKNDPQGEGTFLTSLKKTETSVKPFADVKVEVAFSAAALRLRIQSYPTK